MGSPLHRFAEHTSEVQLELEAASLPELFAEAARALAELFAGELPPVPAGAPSERISLQARNLELLLVDWLNELVYRSELRSLVFPEVELEKLEGGELVATVRGVHPRVVETPVKAATLHRLKVQPVEGGFQGTVVLDV